MEAERRKSRQARSGFRLPDALNLSSYRWKEVRSAYGFLLPGFILLAVFWLYPLVRAFLLSFQNFNLISGQGTFIGLRNYLRLLQDQAFIDSLANTFYFAGVVIPLQTAIALGLALLVKRQLSGVGIFRTIYFLPVVIAFAVAATVFRLIYNSDAGLLNVLLEGFGLGSVEILSNPGVAMLGVIGLGIWKAAGFFMIVFLAGLNNIPEELYEAAEVDGAAPLTQFFVITLPLLKRTMAFVIIITTMDAFKIFVPIYITTSGGGPAGATATVVYYIYKTAFDHLHLGYATAAAFIFFVIVLCVSLLEMQLFRSDVEY